MIKNITNNANGEYVCSVAESNGQNEVQISYSVVVNSEYYYYYSEIKTN